MIGHRVAEVAFLPTEHRPPLTDQTLHIVGPRPGMPVDGAELKMVVPAFPIRGGRLVGHRVAESAGLGAQCLPPLEDGAVHLMRAGPLMPVDDAVLIDPVAPLSIARILFRGFWLSQKAAGASKLVVLLIDLAHVRLLCLSPAAGDGSGRVVRSRLSLIGQGPHYARTHRPWNLRPHRRVSHIWCSTFVKALYPWISRTRPIRNGNHNPYVAKPKDGSVWWR